jgi:hypothetical protein
MDRGGAAGFGGITAVGEGNSTVAEGIRRGAGQAKSLASRIFPPPGPIGALTVRASLKANCFTDDGSRSAKPGIEHCFAGFLPKPHVVMGDQEPDDWKRFAVVHPINASGKSGDDYRKLFERY